MKPLSELLADGSIVDNTVHEVDCGWFRRGASGDWLELREGKKWNHPKNVWPLLRRASDLEPVDHEVLRFGENYEHNTTDQFIQLSGGDWNLFTLTTGNLIGCVRDGEYTLKVSSRFGDEFIKFIIADAEGFKELPDQGGEQHGGYEWLLVYLWLIKLKKAFRLGLPKAYETRTEHLTTVRGRLDPVDYAMNSDRARYRCTYREHSYDNETTRLIARTLQHLDGHAVLRDTHGLNQTFQIATAGARHPLGELLQTKLVRNPFYADYNEVITLSKRILRDDLADFGAKARTSAFFFDVSMLFEYFVRKLLKRAGARFRDKNGAAWMIPTGTRDRKLIPDLVFDVGGRTFVFDVKYKRFDFAHGVAREDLFQLHTYVAHLANEAEVAGCGFIYPVRESRWNQQRLGESGGLWISQIKQHGCAIPFVVAFIRVPEPPADAEEMKNWPKLFPEHFRAACSDLTNGLLRKLSAS